MLPYVTVFDRINSCALNLIFFSDVFYQKIGLYDLQHFFFSQLYIVVCFSTLWAFKFSPFKVGCPVVHFESYWVLFSGFYPPRIRAYSAFSFCSIISIFLNKKVVSRKWMPTSAVRLPSVTRAYSNASKDVDFMRDWLKMFWIHTGAVAAQMVQNKPARNWSY